MKYGRNKMLGRYTVGRFAQFFFCIRDSVTNTYLRRGDVGEVYGPDKILLYNDYINAKKCCNNLNEEVEKNGVLCR
jgi:hypothetical protein